MCVFVFFFFSSSQESSSALASIPAPVLAYHSVVTLSPLGHSSLWLVVDAQLDSHCISVGLFHLQVNEKLLPYYYISTFMELGKWKSNYRK